MSKSESTGDTRRRRARVLTLHPLAVVLALAGSLPACSVDNRVLDTQEGTLAGEPGAGQGGAGTQVPGAPGTDVPAAGTSGAGGPEVVGPTPLAARARPTKLDLLFMVDNSGSMSDKQEILRRVAPDLMSRLVNPICLDAEGNPFPAPAPGAGERAVSPPEPGPQCHHRAGL